MSARKELLSATAHIPLTAAGRVEFFDQRGEPQPPINKIKLQQLQQPATASIEGGPGNATEAGKN